jgi:hypothetical protein
LYKTLPSELSKLRRVARAAQQQLGPDLGVEEELREDETG